MLKFACTFKNNYNSWLSRVLRVVRHHNLLLMNGSLWVLLREQLTYVQLLSRNDRHVKTRTQYGYKLRIVLRSAAFFAQKGRVVRAFNDTSVVRMRKEGAKEGRYGHAQSLAFSSSSLYVYHALIKDTYM